MAVNPILLKIKPNKSSPDPVKHTDIKIDIKENIADNRSNNMI